MIRSVLSSSYKTHPLPFVSKKNGANLLFPLVIAGIFTSTIAAEERNPLDGSEYRIIKDIYPKGLLSSVEKKARESLAMSESIPTLRKLVFRPIQDHFYFSETHELLNSSILHSHEIKDEKLFDFYKTTLERFAKELKLQRLCLIHIQCTRIDSASKPIFQPWHYDQKTSNTMSLILHNDCSYVEGKGLDICRNKSYGPFSFSTKAIEDFSSMIPDKSSLISLEYPANGAILISSKRGHILHRRSPIKESKSPCSRISFQVMLIDETWGPI
jgi:hypothetical protein